MTLQAGAYVRVNPSFEEPEILTQWTQPSGFIHTLAGAELRTRLGEEDLLVYAKQLNMRTKIASGQASMNELPGVDIAASMLSISTYRTQVRSIYNQHDENAAALWGFGLVDAYRLAMRQAHFQIARDASLKGMNPANGEGILNAPGVTYVNLPPDPFGNSTFSTYDNGAMAFLLAQQVGAIKQRTLQLGLGRDITVIGPMQDLQLFEYNVVQLTQYQREGAGTASTAQTFQAILMANGDKVTWTYDDTLIGAGPGGTDAIIITMPQLEKPAGPSPVNTNEFAKLTPGNLTCTTQYCDMAAPREITSPMAGGATDFLMEWRISPGWALRPQATTVLYGSH